MYSRYIVRGIAIISFGEYCYLLKKDWDSLKARDDEKISKI